MAESSKIFLFKDSIAAFLPTWRTVEIRAVADLDTMTLLSMVACLSPSDPGPSEVTEPIQGIVFVREACSIARLDEILSGLGQDAITLGRYQLSTSNFSSYQSTDLSSAWEDIVLGWPELRTYRQFVLYSYGQRNLDAIVQSRDIESVARVLGFNSFAELSLHRVGFKMGGAVANRIEIFAPVIASIEARADTGQMEMSIRTHEALQTNDLAVSYRVQDSAGNRLDGGTIQIERFNKITRGHFTILHLTASIPSKSASAEVHLFDKHFKSGREPIATAHFTIRPPSGETNPQWELLLSLVRNTRAWTKAGIEPEERIRQWLGLSQPRPQEDDFERAVTMLLFAAGLSVIQIGDAEGVDQLVVLHEPERAAILVSCTTSDVGRKISKLMEQLNRARDELPEFPVHAAVFAPLELRDLRVGDAEDCKGASIKLVLRPDIHALFDQVRGIGWSEFKKAFAHTLMAQQEHLL